MALIGLSTAILIGIAVLIPLFIVFVVGYLMGKGRAKSRMADRMLRSKEGKESIVERSRFSNTDILIYTGSALALISVSAFLFIPQGLFPHVILYPMSIVGITSLASGLYIGLRNNSG